MANGRCEVTVEEVVVPLAEAGSRSTAIVGGKAHALGRLLGAGVPGLDGRVVSTAAYRRFVAHNGLVSIATAEIERRARVRSRAEEYWDSALRIRSAFMSADWPADLKTQVFGVLGPMMGVPLAVRSSASHLREGTRGLVRMYDSMTGPRDSDELLNAIKWVWSSLFSDRALLYAAELGLDAMTSGMAVIVQPMLEPRASGIAYTRHPRDLDHMVIEAVSGPAEGLASGSVRPQSWVLDRGERDVIEQGMGNGAEPPGQRLLHDEEVAAIARYAMTAEQVAGEPQACEFAIVEGHIKIVESRAVEAPPVDARSDYLGVRLPESRLELRRTRIESEYLPSMWSEANALSIVDLSSADDEALVAEAARRAEAVSHWRHVYKTVLAPFAHGQRLFGEYYVRMLAPADPFAFVPLLVRTPEEFENRRQIMAELGVAPPPPPATGVMRERAETLFLEAVPPAEQEHARWLLDLARASWSMRDDDNLYLDRIEKEARRCYDEIHRRLEAAEPDAGTGPRSVGRDALDEAAGDLRALGILPDEPVRSSTDGELAERPAELRGDPAAPGVASGPARIVDSPADILTIGPGEVIVVREMEPEMAAAVARAAAVVEGRGGMFAHGAVLAREYGLPCVTGVPDPTSVIRQGEPLEVDGSAGVVRFTKP